MDNSIEKHITYTPYENSISCNFPSVAVIKTTSSLKSPRLNISVSEMQAYQK